MFGYGIVDTSKGQTPLKRICNASTVLHRGLISPFLVISSDMVKLRGGSL